MKTMKEVREAFWLFYLEFKSHRRATKKQNDYNCDIRVSFISYIELLRKDGIITESLAYRITL